MLASGAFAQSLRIGGAAIGNASYASLTTSLAAPAVSVDGSRIAAAGTLAINLSSSLLATQHFDLPTVGAANSLLPNSVQDVVPDASSCGSASQCFGSGGLLAIIDPTTAVPGLAVSTGDFPRITISNLGSAVASSLSIAAAGYSVSSNCGSSLSPASQCSIALNGSGPGSLTLSAGGLGSTTLTLPASTSTPHALALSAPELDFGIVSAASPATTRTLSVTNLSGTPQTFSATRDAGPSIAAYTLAIASTTCAQSAQNQFTVPANSACTLTFALAASTSSSNDGPVYSIWKIGAYDVTLTGFAQAAAHNLSASEIYFGPQSPLPDAKHPPRYLFLSNNSQTALAHISASLPAKFTFHYHR